MYVCVTISRPPLAESEWGLVCALEQMEMMLRTEQMVKLELMIKTGKTALMSVLTPELRVMMSESKSGGGDDSEDGADVDDRVGSEDGAD